MPFLPWRDPDTGDLLQLEYYGAVPTRDELPDYIAAARRRKEVEVNPFGETGVRIKETLFGPEGVPKDELGNPDLTKVRNLGTALQLAIDPVGTSFGPEAPKKLVEAVAPPTSEHPGVLETTARTLAEKALPIASSPVTAMFSVPGVATSLPGRIATGAFGVSAAKGGGEALGTALALRDEGRGWTDPEVVRNLVSGAVDVGLAPLMLGHALEPALGVVKDIAPDVLQQGVGEAARHGLETVREFEAGLTPGLDPEAGVVKWGEGRPPVPDGFIRLYRGGEGSSFFTPLEERAGSYARETGEGAFVDVPREVYEAGKAEAARLGQPRPDDTYLPDEWVKRAQPTTLKQEVYEAQDTGQSIEDILKEMEVEDLGQPRGGVQLRSPEGGPEAIPEVAPPGPPERQPGPMNATVEAPPAPGGSPAAPSTPPEALAANHPLVKAYREDPNHIALESFEGELTPTEAQFLVKEEPGLAKYPWMKRALGEEVPPAVPPRVQESLKSATEELTYDQFKERTKEWADEMRQDRPAEEVENALKQSFERGIDPTKSDDLNSLSDYMDAVDATGERTEPGNVPPFRPKVEEVIKPGETPALEAATPPQSYADFMKQKFGDRATTSKERAVARAEWNAIRDQRRIIKLGERAGIPPDKLQAMLEGMPKPSEEAANLSTLRRAAMPVIENLGKVHPWLREVFDRYVDSAERPAARLIADSYRIKHALSHAEQREVIEILDGKKAFDQASTPKVAQAAGHYRAMLDQVWNDAVAAGVVKGPKRQTYFPHKFAEGWDDNLLRMPQLDKNWNLREPHLEKARMTKRGDYRRDLGVLDEYFMSSYRRISEVQNFGKRLEVLRRFLRKMPMDKATSDWLHTNIRRVMGREAPGTFDIISGHARHVQALSDLGLAAFYQPIQGTNTALYGGIARSARAMRRLAKDYPNEVYDAMRSGALTPAITQEVIQGAYGASEGIRSPALQKFMYGIPTIDKWTRIHANTVGKMLVEDALKGSKGAARDIETLMGKGYDFKAADAYDRVGKALSDKALFRTGTLEVPGWASSGYGKLATQYCRFMYRHSVFVSGLFRDAAQGNVVPLARFLVAAGTIIPGMAEALYPVREGIRNVIKQGVSGEFDTEKLKEESIGDPRAWNTEVGWADVLRNRRIPWNHPLKRYLQNLTLWGGLGVFQIMIERASRGGGAFERGARAMVGPVPANVYEGVGTIPPDIRRAAEGEWPRYVPRWILQQVPIAGYPLAEEAFPPVTAWSRHRPRRRRR